MDPVGLAVTGLILAVVGFTIYLANEVILNPARATVLRLVLIGITGASILYGVLLMGALLADGGTRSAGAWLGLAVTAATGLFSAAVLLSDSFRNGLRRVLGSAYDPVSPVQLTGLVLCSALLSYTVIGLISVGGTEGLAEAINSEGISPAETLFQSALWVLAALLGVGLFIRRSPGQAQLRLDLRMPSLMDAAVGIGSGFLFYGVVLAGGLVWLMLSSPEQIAAQSVVSSALASSVTSVGEALALSLPVAIGEELFFRGALQPVFGLLPTSLFFAALHAQYGFTPALVALLIVGLGLGVVARRHGTVAAILAHFVFNFVQLSLALLASSMLPGGG